MPFRPYLNAIGGALSRGDATEHTHRPALKALVESLESGIVATNEPKRIACGAPDFIISRGQVPVGYIEAKDVGLALEAIENDEQLKRYRASLRNLILTDYLEFRWYRNGELVLSARVGKWQRNAVLRKDARGIADAGKLFAGFLQAEVEAIGSPRDLAEKMARLARLIHDLIAKAFTAEGAGGELHAQYEGFKQVLIADLTPPQFADMYAQTICYGLFAARCNHVGGPFTRQSAAYELPRTNPFLREVFSRIAGVGLDDRIAWAVEDLALLLSRADMISILADFGKRTRREDPVVHFYETFLAAYDPKLRETRGVYYTPEPVVSYIVRSVDAILKRDFGLRNGLADASKIRVKTGTGKRDKRTKTGERQEEREVHRVQILDPAAGTGTFLYAVTEQMRERFIGNAGMWPGYVAEHLLPRLYGFELLIAPYAVAHMKLDLQLRQSGYDFASDERLRVYLTNTLEEAHELAGLPLFAAAIAHEAASASMVKKDAPIMVVLGNPPYSGHSANTGEWINGLLRGFDALTGTPTGNYFLCDGKALGERNPKWLNDDYVKFLRFAQWRIEKTGYGILAFITNHGYLDNPTFRGMRQSLIESFDAIYLLDLHGNSKKKEKAPDGGPDENVFDIQQGVAIGIFVRGGGTRSRNVHHADLWGSRESKYAWLWEHDVGDTHWTTLAPESPSYMLVPQDTALLAEYTEGWKITEAMPINVLGFQTHRDKFAIDLDRSRLEARFAEMRDTAISDADFAERYGLHDNRDWQLRSAREALRKDEHWRDKVIVCAYRPFDHRWCYFSEVAMDYPRRELRDHVAGKENRCLLLPRQIGTYPWQHAWVADNVAESCTISTKTKEQNYCFPLHGYHGYPAARTDLFDGGWSAVAPIARRPNFADGFCAALSRALQLTFMLEGCGDLSKTFGPEDVFHYTYAVFYSPTYRMRYAQYLKNDFPRLPLTSDRGLFRHLCGLGRRLVALHLMEEDAREVSRYPVAGSNEVTKVSFVSVSDANRIGSRNPAGSPDVGRVYINAEQYFEEVPTPVWEYHVGGYQVCHKWLKDRKGRLLSYDDIKNYHRIVAALAETIDLQEEIDAVIPGWPLK